MVDSSHNSRSSRGPYSTSQLGGPSSINRRISKVMGSTFTLDQRYQIQDVLGTGAYGIVVSARDRTNSQRYAVKKIQKAFQHSTFTKRTLRELKILRLLNHQNIMDITSIQLPVSREEFEQIYVVSELMETDLSSIIRSPQPLSDEHCQFFLYQILRGMKYMHSAKILHRDLKPRNILVNSNCDLKICDFGLARPYIPQLKVTATSMTDYVATRWYRPPELLLTYKNYTAAMDVWSIGCVFGQLLLRKPILPGTDANHQLDIIFNMIGSPSEEDIQNIPNVRAKEKVMKLPRKQARPLQMMFRDANPLALDLLRSMLIFNPDKRITVEEALDHPYLSALHCAEDEPVSKPVSLFDFEFERQLHTMRDLKDLIYEEILLYHFQDKKESYEKAKAEYLEQVDRRGVGERNGVEEDE